MAINTGYELTTRSINGQRIECSSVVTCSTQVDPCPGNDETQITAVQQPPQAHPIFSFLTSYKPEDSFLCSEKPLTRPFANNTRLETYQTLAF
jgi:hypothetical protein